MAPTIFSMTFIDPWRKNVNPIPDVSLAGRTVLMTGGNAGLGLEAAIHFARLSPSLLILACRNTSSGESAADRIAAETPLARDRIQVWQLDLASFASVKAFGEKARELERLDVACLNAGVGELSWKETGDGWEQMLQVNVLSTGLLAIELLPLLLKTGDLPVPPGGEVLKPHLTIISSDVHYVCRFKEREAVTSGKHTSYLSALNDQSIGEIAKLPNVKGRVVVNAVNPGLTKSGFRDGFGVIASVILNFLAKDTAAAAENYVYAGVVDTDKDAPDGGAFVSLGQVVAPSDFVLSEDGTEISAKVFEELKALWKKEDPKAVEAIFA